MEKANLFQEVREEILFSKEYIDFEKVISLKNNNKIKGDYQEIFAKFYFESHQKHYDIKHYYSRLLDDIPDDLGVNSKDVGTN